MSTSDQTLIARVVAKQDQHAFAQLVLRYQSQVRHWARRLCDGDAHLADDLAQETFIKAYAALPAFRAQAKFSTWLYRITFNLAANRWRAKKVLWCELEDNQEVEASNCDIQNFAIKQDVESALGKLSAPQQLAIRLCYEEGFSHQEVADIMGIPLGTVKTHILRGKQQLEVLLASWSHTP